MHESNERKVQLIDQFQLQIHWCISIFQKGKLLTQVNNNTYHVLFTDNSVENYNNNENITKNLSVISFKYSNISVTNTSYLNIGFNKVADITLPPVIEKTVISSDIKWVDSIQTKLFSSVQFMIDDAIIENLDYDTYTIYTHYMIDNWKRSEFNKMI